MKVYWDRGGIAPRILHLGTRRKLVVSYTPRPLYHQSKNHLYPPDRRLSEPQNRYGHGGEEKNAQPLPGFETADHIARTAGLYH
jgi:hypothetical protein